MEQAGVRSRSAVCGVTQRNYLSLESKLLIDEHMPKGKISKMECCNFAKKHGLDPMQVYHYYRHNKAKNKRSVLSMKTRQLLQRELETVMRETKATPKAVHVRAIWDKFSVKENIKSGLSYLKSFLKNMRLRHLNRNGDNISCQELIRLYFNDNNRVDGYYDDASSAGQDEDEVMDTELMMEEIMASTSPKSSCSSENLFLPEDLDDEEKGIVEKPLLVPMPVHRQDSRIKTIYHMPKAETMLLQKIQNKVDVDKILAKMDPSPEMLKFLPSDAGKRKDGEYSELEIIAMAEAVIGFWNDPFKLNLDILNGFSEAEHGVLVLLENVQVDGHPTGDKSAMRVVLAFGILLYLKGDFDKAYAFTSKWHDRLLLLASRPVCKMGGADVVDEAGEAMAPEERSDIEAAGPADEHTQKFLEDMKTDDLDFSCETTVLSASDVGEQNTLVVEEGCEGWDRDLDGLIPDSPDWTL
jgi:hypothetical protein